MSQPLSPDILAAYQHEMIDFILAKPKCALWVDMGLGKTVSTLTAVQKLLEHLEVGRVLVIAPLRVAKSTWPDEIAKWSHTHNIKHTVVCGTEKQRLSALKQDAELYFINQENVVWLVDILNKKWPFDMIVIDEASSFRNHASKRFKALKKVAHLSNRVVELTGTPTPKGLINLWSQIYFLDQGERLGKNITAFRGRWFYQLPWGYDWIEQSYAKKEIEGLINDLVLVLDKNDHIHWPEPEYRSIEVGMPLHAQGMYRELEREFILELENAEVVEAVNAAVLTGKLRQCANGALYTDEQGSYKEIHDAKLDALQQLVRVHKSESILVAYNFQSDKERILRRFPQAEVLTSDPDVIRRWNKGKIPILLAHPASAGHGLNLQEGGRIACWFSCTWDLELHLQFNARLARRGQDKKVKIYSICVKNTVDENIAQAIEKRDKSQDRLLNALKNEIIVKNNYYKEAG